MSLHESNESTDASFIARHAAVTNQGEGVEPPTSEPSKNSGHPEPLSSSALYL